VRDVLDSLAAHGFKRVLVVNGHGGNQPVSNLAKPDSVMEELWQVAVEETRELLVGGWG
jgi:creatinine amidohydrolase/Fe(II)-dependent formamide hydrolase-like protein